MTFIEKKALLQLWGNPILTSFTLNRKRSMAVIYQLVDKGYLVPEEDEEDPCAFFLTDKAKNELNLS